MSSMKDEEMKDMAIQHSENQNFTPIHVNKRLPQPACLAALCSTMDLIAIGLRKKKIQNIESQVDDKNTIQSTGSTTALESHISYSNSISVYRTMSWQKMFVVTETDLSNALSDQKYVIDSNRRCRKNSNSTTKNNVNNAKSIDDDKESSSTSSSYESCVSQLAWSPDGRTLVLGLSNGSLLLYDIESSATSPGGVPPKPVVFLPPPPLSSFTDTMNYEGMQNNDEKNRDIKRSGGVGGGSNDNSCSHKDANDKKQNTYDDEDGSLSSMLSTSTTSPISISDPTTKSTATATTTTTTNISNNNFSPAVTRSMAAARRKQQLEQRSQQQLFKTLDPMEEKSVTTMTTATSSMPANDFDSIYKGKQGTTIQEKASSTNKIGHNNYKEVMKLFEREDKNSVVSLQWQRMNPIYKDWNKTIKEENDDVSWSFQSHYLDKATHFLPPCAYNATYPSNKYTNIQDELNPLLHGSGGIGGSGLRQASENFDTHNDFEESIDRYRPKCETPMNVLFAVTAGNGVHMYLQGRYRLLSLPSPIALCNHSTSIKATSDLSCILISVKESFVQNEVMNSFGDKNNHNQHNDQQYQEQPFSSQLIMYSIPNITKKRYQLQTITSSYCSIMSHLTTIHGGMNEASSAWSGALRQLDMKFDQLSTLLKKYGVMPSTCTSTIEKMSVVRMELLNYILGGHSKRSTDTSNAMDQFFTNPLMNDQLLQRLIRPLEANVAGVEGMIRKKMLGPVRALMYDVGELHGLVKVMNIDCTAYNTFDDHDGHGDHDDGIGGGDDDLPSMNEHTSLRLYEASEVLYFVAQQCVSQLVEIRIRLNSMMKWIRGTASQVKARGTAMDSVQRENARKRRVPEQIVRKIADFLSTTLKSDGDDIDGIKRGSSECILGILFSDYFTKDKVSIEKSPTPLKQKTVNGRFGKDIMEPIETPSVKAALEISTQIAIDLFEEPRSIGNTAIQTRICLEEQIAASSNSLLTSIHNRIGAAANSVDDVKNCFNPSVVKCAENMKYTSRHWIIIANTCTCKIDSKHVLQISALPKDQHEVQGMDDIKEDTMEFQHPYYLTTFVAIPEHCKISDIVFYGDDGNSTLTSETSSNDEEGRQALGLLLQRSIDSNIQSEEVWMFCYDDLDFRLVPLPESDVNDNFIRIKRFDKSNDTLYFLTNDAMMEEDDTEYGSIKAKWRRVKDETNSPPPSRLVVSGSKGIGGVTSERINVIDIFDLEEDECEESDSDEE